MTVIVHYHCGWFLFNGNYEKLNIKRFRSGSVLLAQAHSKFVMAYVRAAGRQGYRFAAVCRSSKAPAFLCTSPRGPIANCIDIQDGCFSPAHAAAHRHSHQQRHYASVGSSVTKAGASWFKRKLYTVLVVAGLSGGALVYVS